MHVHKSFMQQSQNGLVVVYTSFRPAYLTLLLYILIISGLRLVDLSICFISISSVIFTRVRVQKLFTKLAQLADSV